jgi:nucleoside-diphosphate-sugar epimerase
MSTTVAVTGGAGFLGSHVVDFFVDQGEEVVVVDDFSSGEYANLQSSLDEIEVREANLTSDDARKELADIDILVHLAAKIGGIGYFHDVPADIIAKNDAMNKVVFDAAVEHDIDRMVYASSSMVYERATDFPVTEDDVMEIPPPMSAYGFQKLAGEYYCEAYHDQYDVEYSIFRPFNAVGPREPPGEEVGQAHVIPDFVMKILEKQQYPMTILGDGSQVRSFTNVRDIASGVYRCALMEDAANDDFNLGSEEDIEMRELAAQIWERCDRDRKIEFETTEPLQHDVGKRVPSSRKAKDILGWEPEVSLDESLDEYIAWYREKVL